MSQTVIEPAPSATAMVQASVADRREPFLVIENVVKRFGNFVALAGVSLRIQPGELISFVGPSGCGKTTLLRAIAGLDPPTSGHIVQAGHDITALPPSEHDFGIVFQSYALFPNLTVTDNIGYGLRGREWPKERVGHRVQEMVTLIGLQEHERKYPAQLSGGQQQRVALARALASEPGLLLLDEPLSALDALVRLHLRSEIRALQRRLGVTTILVTHDQEEAMSVSDRLVVLNKGHIEQVGTPKEVYREPATSFVAGFIGRSTEVDGTVESDGVVRAKGVALRVEAASRMSPGSAVHVFIRPEDVLLGEDAGGNQSANTCKVTSIEYLGPICRVGLQAGDMGIEADIRPDEIGHLGLGSGRPIPMMIPPERVMVFPADV